MKHAKITHWLANNLRLNWFTLPLWLWALNKAMDIMSNDTFDDFSKTNRPITWLKDSYGMTPFEQVESEMSYWDND
jgi:hypothetical protein